MLTLTKMFGVPKITVARPGYDIKGIAPKDLSFSSEYNLNKIARAIRITDNTATAHGLPYTPKIRVMREVTSNKFGWGGVATVDFTNVTPTKATGIVLLGYVFVDPLVSGTYKKNMTNKPRLLVGKIHVHGFLDIKYIQVTTHLKLLKQED